MQILNPPITEYMSGLLPERHAAFLRMEKEAEEKNFPIVGPLVGNYLAQLARVTGARRIMELGSGFGYSALWFAGVLDEEGEIICTDGSASNRAAAERTFAEVGVRPHITFHTGDALQLFARTEGTFDLIFCDIDKHEYPQAFRAAIPRLRPGGVLAFDNALWYGRMLEGDADAATAGVAELNRIAFSDERVHAALVPIRDGVLVCSLR